MNFTVTPVFVALLVLLNLVFLFPIGPLRLKTKIIFWGGDAQLDRLVRGHGNFIEFAPLTLIALGSAEILGANPTLLWGCGAVFVLARVLHYVSIQVMGTGRLLGTVASMSVMLVLAGTNLYQLYFSG